MTDRKSSRSPQDAPLRTEFPTGAEINPETLASKWRAPAKAPESLPAGLYVTATPIGNLRDITLRALDVLAGVDVIACEDTRQTGKLLSHFGIKTPTRAYHDHSNVAARDKLVAEISGGARVALVSDAGTPLISDPGYKLVAAAREAGVSVFAIPGPSSMAAAISIAGLPSNEFSFAGFLPPKSAARRTELERLKAFPGTLLLFESAKRLAGLLADAHQVLGNRDGAVARELTKKFEEVTKGTLAELAAHYADAGAPKGEIVVVIGPSPASEGAGIDLDAALLDALKNQSVKDAASDVAALTGRPRREVYARALELKSSDD